MNYTIYAKYLNDHDNTKFIYQLSIYHQVNNFHKQKSEKKKKILTLNEIEQGKKQSGPSLYLCFSRRIRAMSRRRKSVYRKLPTATEKGGAGAIAGIRVGSPVNHPDPCSRILAWSFELGYELELIPQHRLLPSHFLWISCWFSSSSSYFSVSRSSIFFDLLIYI